ncbi:hypothetical protein CO230_05300 [Chryseobacterium sp. 6424]|uniref:M23 family metallopeptidase n=1 Tax=Chryseobacterium sp. 6424 TaxID=2039166 RepID=UPI000EFC934F|nr:M23 family metallopeptidase [Chryseobacterium sp. 6424]AYO57587.1 hypothetical protein CO230_05300 [Chryseobacterium sp. 6424]
MFRLKNVILTACVSIVLLACDGFKMPKNIFDSSARARYERSFKGADSLMTEWKKNFEVAATSQLSVHDGFSAIVEYEINDLHALAYHLELNRGERLIIKAGLPESPGQRIFVDVDPADSPVSPASSQLLQADGYSEVIENTGRYRIIIQPEIGFSGTFNLRIYTQPSLAFPVAGKGNAAVQSFWGAARDGGARNHEGVDIFAARGTPVVAAVDGIVMRTGHQGLGGKQVWLRDGLLGNSLYYAHLDSVMTTAGTRVRTGDTLGTVGTTGNAKGGSPHLHFGIYSTGSAVDPWPFLRKRDAAKSSPLKIPALQTLKASSNLRRGPGADFEIIANVPSKTSVRILAHVGDWLHIKTESLEGFVLLTRLY